MGIHSHSDVCVVVDIMQQKVKAVANFPLRGEWVCLKPPGHHPDALDFMKVNKYGRRYRGRIFSSNLLIGIPAENFYGWGKPIFAPCDGVVVRASDGWMDRKVTSIINTVFIWVYATFFFRPKINGSEIDIRPNAGNYVMIRTATGAVVFLAHMRSGSIKVMAKQSVTAGQLIGEVGNSGNTTTPHLHINIFDQADNLLRAQVMPFVFSRYERWDGKSWEMVENNVPIKRELVRFYEDR